MNHAPLCLFCLLTALSLLSCTPQTPQIVVPVVGKQMADYQASRENRIEQLKRDFPTLPQTALDAFTTIPRPLFVADLARHRAYEDQMLPIGSEQATLRLSDIAWLITTLKIQPSDTILEIGTGTGYMTAILARTGKFVYTIELNEYLAENAQTTLARLKVENVRFRTHDGLEGWKNKAPFDVIIYTAAVQPNAINEGDPPEKLLPPDIVSQLNPGGRIAIPLIESANKTPWKVYAYQPVPSDTQEALDDNATSDSETTCHLVEIASRKANIPHAIVP